MTALTVFLVWLATGLVVFVGDSIMSWYAGDMQALADLQAVRNRPAYGTNGKWVGAVLASFLVPILVWPIVLFLAGQRWWNRKPPERKLSGRERRAVATARRPPAP